MSKRLHFIDVLRLIALLQMVNGHTLHAVLAQHVRSGATYAGYLWFRGLVSVAFMLAAGLSFYITTLCRPNAQAPAERQRRMLRALEIIAIGCLLRLPLSALLSGEPRALEAALASLARIDVLPCIGVSLLALEGLLALAPRAVVPASAALALAAALLSGWGASLPTELPVGFVTGWLGPQGGSAFPLLPYAGYVFAGVTLGWLALPLAAATPPAQLVLRLSAAACVLWLVSRGLEGLPRSWLGATGPGIHTPAFFTLKLAAVALASACLALALRRVRALPRPLAILTRETLGIYVFHLFVLYGAPLNLARRIGTTLELPAALGVSATLVLLSAGFGLGWQRLKELRGSHALRAFRSA